MTKGRITAVIPLLLLAACNNPKPAAEAENGSGKMASEEAVPNEMAVGSEIAFECTPKTALTVRYDNSDAEAPKATVTLDGKAYDMANVSSASGAKYSSAIGRAEGMTLTWWTKGSEGTLYEGKKGGDDTETTIAECKEKA